MRSPVFTTIQAWRTPGVQTLSIRVLGRRRSLSTSSRSPCFPVSWRGPTYDAAVMAKGSHESPRRRSVNESG